MDPKQILRMFTIVFTVGSVIYALSFILYLLFFHDAGHPLGFQIDGEPLRKQNIKSIV